MSQGDRNVAIVIGVANSVPRKFLGGALNSARAFEDWAKRQGYETVLLIDDSDAVTLTDVRREIENILRASPKPIHRIIVYFAGHGLIREMEEGLWLVSDWRSELRAIAVEVLKRRLTMYGPGQITIISDACRSLPADVDQADLVPDPLLGAGPKAQDLSIPIDKFIAAQDGTEAFMIPGDDPAEDRCLFSGVLVEGLWGQPGLNGSPFSRGRPTSVTSQSLAAYLRSEVPARAGEYDLKLVPTTVPSFPEEDDYYFTRDPALQVPTFPPWPPKEKVTSQRASPPDSPRVARIPAAPPDAEEFEISMERLSLSVGRAGKRRGRTPRPSAISRLRNQPVPGPLDGVHSSLSAPEANALWLAKDAAADYRAEHRYWAVNDPERPFLTMAAPALVEYPDGRFGSAVALPDHFGAVTRDEHGVDGLLYREVNAPEDDRPAAEKMLAALERGVLRADQATDWAVELRKLKHLDPVMGVISAYLYDAIGDTESIIRMATFYAEYEEAIPYDLALLAGLKGDRNAWGFKVQLPAVLERAPRTRSEESYPWTYSARKARAGQVVGWWPWMRQGWTFLDDPSDFGSPLIVPELLRLRPSLMRSRFTTLERDAALKLAGLFQLQRWPGV